MKGCLHDVTTLGRCPNPRDDDVFKNAKLAKYWSYFLNKRPPSSIAEWFTGNTFSKTSASPSFMASGQLVKQEASIWRQMLMHVDTITKSNAPAPYATCDIAPIDVVLKCFFVPDKWCKPRKPISQTYTMETYNKENRSIDMDRLGLTYEKDVYSCVVANLEEVPFFVFPLATVQKRCTQEEITDYENNALGTKKDNIDWQLLTMLVNDKYHCLTPGTWNITVSENCGRTTLNDYIKIPEYYLEEVRKLMKQRLAVQRPVTRANPGVALKPMSYNMHRWAVKRGLLVNASAMNMTVEQFETLERAFKRKYLVAVMQLLTGLKIMQVHGLCHNDLHFGNILVKEGESFYFDCELKKVISDDDEIKRATFFEEAIQMDDMVKIFDWDRAHADKQGTNGLLRYYPYYTKKYNKSADMLSALRQLKLYDIMSKSTKTMERLETSPETKWAMADTFEIDGRTFDKRDYPQIACKPIGKGDPSGFKECDEWPEEAHDLINKWAEEVYEYARSTVKKMDVQDAYINA